MTIIERQSVAAQAYKHLRSEIGAGNLKQGDPVVEARLAKELGVSRAPIREAAQKLAHEGLLESDIGRSWKVTELTPDGIRHLFLIRVQVEQLAVAHIIENNPKLAARKLRESLERIRSAARKRDFYEVSEAEIQFHLDLCALSGNNYVIMLYDVLAAHVRLSLRQVNTTYSTLDEIAEEHVPLINAIEKKDVELAQRLVKKHIIDALEEKLTAIKEQERESR